ncbi:MAG: hypothetical protein ABW061_15160, partial [Polyangiaceae bacterium]
VELYQEGDLAGALAEFRRADALSPAYRLKYNIAQVCQEQHDYACALSALGAYLSGGGGEISKAKRASVELEIQKLNAFVAELTVSVDTPGAEILIDDASCGVAPLSAPFKVNAGRHRVSARQGALVATRSVEVAGGEQAQLSLLLAPTADSAPTRQRAALDESTLHSAPDRTPAWISGLGAGVFLVGAAVTGALALHESSQLSSERAQYPASTDQLRSTRDRASHLALASDILGLLAIGSGVGAVYFAVRPVSSSATPAAALSLRGGF